jgi:RNA polymerase-binding transcription factor DksA
MATKKPAPKKPVKATKTTAKSAKKVTTKPVAKAAEKKVSETKVISNAPAKVATAKKMDKSTVKVTAKKTVEAKVVAKPKAKKADIANKVSATKVVAKVEAKKPVKPVKETVVKKVVVKTAPKPIEKVVIAPVKIDVKPVVKPAKQSPKAKVPPVPTTPAKPIKKALEPIKDVKVGKIITKSSVPYNPVYTPMEKRPNITKSNNPLVTYSDSDLNEFRDLINKKLDTAKKELGYLQGLITRKDEGGGNDEARYMTMEDGSMSMEREQLSQMASRQITYIDHLEKAIMRIENKTYGICRVTGKLIDKARLRAVPHATLSLEAKLGLVKPGNE